MANFARKIAVEMKYQEIEFKPYNLAHNDINCEDGELEGAAGVPSTGFEVKYTIEAGVLIAIHQQCAIVYHEGKLMWALPGEDTHIAADDLMEIAEIQRPTSVAIIGDVLVTAGEDGLFYHHRKDGGYITLPQLPPLPKIEFGLLKVGEMVDTCSITMPVSMVPFQDGSGMTDPHQSANNTGGGDATEYIDKIIDALIHRAHDDKRRRGYFTTPFFVRYALVDHSGNYLCVSPPVLIAGSVLPPCMEVLSVTNDEKNGTIRTRLTGSAYFSLMARACPLPAEWLSVVRSIDIFVSPQIPTWASSAGYLCSYANVLGQVNGGSGQRGRTNSGTADDTMFAGHYSDDGINYTDHYVDSTLRQTRVWYVSPNIGMTAEIIAEHRFYRIASLAPGCLAGMTDFTPLPVETTATSHLESLCLLPDAPESSAIYPEILATLNGRLAAAGGEYALAKPVDIAVTSAFSGSAASTSSLPVEICVFTRLPSGELRRVSAVYDSSLNLASAFPRFIYHPDSSAEIMTIESGNVRYRLPLTRHPTMPGVFWYGGSGSDCRPATDTEALPLASESGRFPCRDRIWLSSPFSPRHFSMSQSIAACNSNITAISTSVVTPDLTAIGKYPVYVFAGDGVWLLEYDSDRLRLCGSHRISSEICASAAAVAPTDDGVAFATDQSLLMLSGSKIKHLISLRALPMLLSSLFYCDVVPSGTKTPLTHISSPMLAYDGATSSLILADTTSGTTCLIDIASHTASLWNRKAISFPLTSGRILIQTDSHEIGYLSPSAGTSGMMITRPIKLTKAFTPKIIRSVTIWHSGSSGSIALKLYGANSLSDWHLIASTLCHRVELPARSRWRFLRLAIIPREGEPEIYGAQIEWREE